MNLHYDINWLTQQFENGTPLKFIYFWGHTHKPGGQVEKSCFSQWFSSPFTVNNITYKTAEHWMMAQKALLFGDKNSFEAIIRCEKPGEAKALGRQVPGYDDQVWNEHKFDIVKLGNIHKFNQHPELFDFLIHTDPRVLVEASPVDAIWGIGLSQDDPAIDNIYAWPGQNLLGFALMETRDFLKSFGHFQPLENVFQPPWEAYPGISLFDIFWRMGVGEDYVDRFHDFFVKLSDRERTIYKLTHPYPNDWDEFFTVNFE